jgi:DNA-binding GntR family transcriptional regulator
LFQVRDTWYPQRIEIALDDHERFLVALIEGRGEEAIKMLSEHIQNSKNGVLTDMYQDEDDENKIS